MKYTDDLVLLTEEETALQDIINRLIETKRSYETKMYLDKN